MEDNNDKSKTMKFNPEEALKKEELDRSDEDIYSRARKTPEYAFDYEEEEYEQPAEESNNKMKYAAVILAIALIIALTVGIVVINNGGEKSKSEKEQIPYEEKEEEKISQDEEPEEEKEEAVLYSIVFYGDSVINKGSYYTILADIYDKNMNKTDSRKLLINSETDIYENGKRITAEAFFYTVETFAGEGIVFDCKIRESDGFAEEISFDGSFKEQLSPTQEEAEEPQDEEPTEDDAPEEEENEENQ